MKDASKTESFLKGPRSGVRAIGVILGYLTSQWLAQLLFLSFITFFTLRSQNSIPKIAEFLDANKLIVYSVGTIAFAVFLQIMNPLTVTRLKDIYHSDSLRALITYHALQGFILAAVLVVGGLLAGHLTWLGFFVSIDEVFLSVASAALFSVCLFGMIVFEEYLLRKVVEPQCRRFGGPLAILTASCLFFVGMRFIQFDLTHIEMVNFALLNIILFGIARKERTHLASATLFVSFLVTLHTFFGMPFLNLDVPSIFLVRSLEAEVDTIVSSSSLNQLLSGGVRGPENSIMLTVLLVVYLSLPWMRTQVIQQTKAKKRAVVDLN